MKKKYLLLAIGIIAAALVHAQAPATYEEDEEKPHGFNINRMFVGGSLSLGFSSYTFQVGGVPEVGYSITDWLDAGISFNVNYYSERADPYWNYNTRYRNFNYGGGPFFRLYPIHFLFIQGQFEHNWIKVNETHYDYNGSVSYERKTTYTSNSLIAGIGYTQRIVGQSSFYTMLGIDLLTDPNSPYRGYGNTVYPIIRAGFNFYLKPSRK